VFVGEAFVPVLADLLVFVTVAGCRTKRCSRQAARVGDSNFQANRFAQLAAER
jgi:hypothetical protein